MLLDRQTRGGVGTTVKSGADIEHNVSEPDECIRAAIIAEAQDTLDGGIPAAVQQQHGRAGSGVGREALAGGSAVHALATGRRYGEGRRADGREGWKSDSAFWYNMINDSAALCWPFPMGEPWVLTADPKYVGVQNQKTAEAYPAQLPPKIGAMLLKRLTPASLGSGSGAGQRSPPAALNAFHGGFEDSLRDLISYTSGVHLGLMQPEIVLQTMHAVMLSGVAPAAWEQRHADEVHDLINIGVEKGWIARDCTTRSGTRTRSPSSRRTACCSPSRRSAASTSRSSRTSAPLAPGATSCCSGRQMARPSSRR